MRWERILRAVVNTEKKYICETTESLIQTRAAVAAVETRILSERQMQRRAFRVGRDAAIKRLKKEQARLTATAQFKERSIARASEMVSRYEETIPQVRFAIGYHTLLCYHDPEAYPGKGFLLVPCRSFDKDHVRRGTVEDILNKAGYHCMLTTDGYEQCSQCGWVFSPRADVSTWNDGLLLVGGEAGVCYPCLLPARRCLWCDDLVGEWPLRDYCKPCCDRVEREIYAWRWYKNVPKTQMDRLARDIRREDIGSLRRADYVFGFVKTRAQKEWSLGYQQGGPAMALTTIPTSEALARGLVGEDGTIHTRQMSLILGQIVSEVLSGSLQTSRAHAAVRALRTMVALADACRRSSDAPSPLLSIGPAPVDVEAGEEKRFLS